MGWAGHSETISETEAVGETERSGPCGLAHLPHRDRVVVIEFAAATLQTRFRRPLLAGKARNQTGTPLQIRHQDSPVRAQSAHHHRASVDPRDGSRSNLEFTSGRHVKNELSGD
jgi:hypothetical protein